MAAIVCKHSGGSFTLTGEDTIAYSGTPQRARILSPMQVVLQDRILADALPGWREKRREQWEKLIQEGKIL